MLMSIMGCAHLGKPPSQPPPVSSTSRPPEPADVPQGSTSREDAPTLPSSTSAKHDQSPGAGTSSRNGPGNLPVAPARSSNGGTAEARKIPSPPTGRSATDKGQPRAVVNGPPTLGLGDIEQRLRDTHAIGVFTKLSLKNQIDDLLNQLRAYHLEKTSASLPQLRQRYDVLLEKVIGLLQSGDASLAKDISSSREAIWSLLANPTTTSQL
jgi:hypothetical protein